jgi:hypothetical protein
LDDNHEYMPLYQSHKLVRALKIAHVTLQPGHQPGDAPIAKVVFEGNFEPMHVDLTGKPTPHRGWYYVVYPLSDGQTENYTSFSPPEAFEKGYRPFGTPASEIFAENAGIGWAIKQMHNGARVCRAGWNGKGMWVAMQIPDEHSKMGRPYLYIKSVDGLLVPWAPSQTDLLAIDWEIAS